jgi:hypothetical protein
MLAGCERNNHAVSFWKKYIFFVFKKKRILEGLTLRWLQHLRDQKLIENFLRKRKKDSISISCLSDSDIFVSIFLQVIPLENRFAENAFPLKLSVLGSTKNSFMASNFWSVCPFPFLLTDNPS